MGCGLSIWRSLVSAMMPYEEITISGKRYVVKELLGEGGFSYVYLVKQVGNVDPGEQKEYALKKITIQSHEQMQEVKAEVLAMQRFSDPNLLPLLDYAIGAAPGQEKVEEAYLLFPLMRNGTLQEALSQMAASGDRFSPTMVLLILLEVSRGLLAMHKSDPPYCHNDVKPHNILLGAPSNRPLPADISELISAAPNQQPIAVLMDFGSAGPAKRIVQSRMDAIALQEWASSNCSAPYRAPELWDCPSECVVDERTDTWALGCTLYAMMYMVSPFEFSLGEAGGSLALAAINGNITWPPSPAKKYPAAMHDLVTWMVDTDRTRRPYIHEVIAKVEDLLRTVEMGRS
eukprot:jgi/Mesvir1/5500/Mv15544-RA.1